ncbi:Uncharacterised protein [Salmonella enterica subsp. enterica]|uniref:Uncharacterized protein n=1 Tax=Salmonella enterica I TaxID=59201 RepID=A0A379WXX7_SALET|nr:Uncharacterised protein [Salmonella enterica subsp. enterica]
MAVEFFASSRRSATRLRRRVIGTRFFAARAQSGLCCRFNSGCFRLAFRQMFFHIFTGQTPTHTSAFNGAGFQIVFSQQATDRRAERIVVLFFQRRLLALCRRRRFLFRFRAGLFTRAVAFTQGDPGSGER